MAKTRGNGVLLVDIQSGRPGSLALSMLELGLVASVQPEDGGGPSCRHHYHLMIFQHVSIFPTHEGKEL